MCFRQQPPRIDPNVGRLHNASINYPDIEPCMDPDRPSSPPGFGISDQPYLSPVKYKDDWPIQSSGNSPGYSEGHTKRTYMPPSPPVTRRPPSPPLPWRPPSPGQHRECSQSPPLGLRSRRQVPPSLELSRITRQRAVTPPMDLGRKSRQRQISPVLSDSGRVTRQRPISPLDNVRVTRQQPASPLTPMERNTRQRGLNMQRRPTLPVGTRRRSPKPPSPPREVRRRHRSPTPPLPPKELRRQRPPSPPLTRETRSRQPQSPPPAKRTRR